MCHVGNVAVGLEVVSGMSMKLVLALAILALTALPAHSAERPYETRGLKIGMTLKAVQSRYPLCRNLRKGIKTKVDTNKKIGVESCCEG